MTDLRKAAEMALDALHNIDQSNNGDAIEALRQALAQQERLNEITRQFVGVNEDGSERWVETEYRTVIRSEWVGLTDDELKSLCDEWQIIYGGYVRPFAETIEAKLKEKNT